MCGGFGSRFWPMSTKGVPKQFLKLIDNKSLLRLTVDSDYCFPHKGSLKCLNAILNRFSSSFSQDMIQATIQHITDKNLTDNRNECLDILRNHLH